MTKQEHIELNLWQREILASLKLAQSYPELESTRSLLLEAAKNLRFLSENLRGGVIHLEDGQSISTGDYLNGLVTLLVRDASCRHLSTVIRCMEMVVTSHDKHLANLAEDN